MFLVGGHKTVPCMSKNNRTATSRVCDPAAILTVDVGHRTNLCMYGCSLLYQQSYRPTMCKKVDSYLSEYLLIIQFYLPQTVNGVLNG